MLGISLMIFCYVTVYGKLYQNDGLRRGAVGVAVKLLSYGAKELIRIRLWF